MAGRVAAAVTDWLGANEALTRPGLALEPSCVTVVVVAAVVANPADGPALVCVEIGCFN